MSAAMTHLALGGLAILAFAKAPAETGAAVSPSGRAPVADERVSPAALAPVPDGPAKQPGSTDAAPSEAMAREGDRAEPAGATILLPLPERQPRNIR